MTRLNLVRYVLGIIIPIFGIIFGDVWFLVSTILVLYANNVLDDILFYYGSCFVDESEYVGGIPCPVEGVITKIERFVPLYNHIHKDDVLTKKVLIEKGLPISDGKYEHITIFLNKFNKHLVLRIGKLKCMKQYCINNENVEMVKSGELVASNKGDYLNNTFVDFEYHNGIHVVVTMDKYISRAVMPNDRSFVEMLICRGSQCDIYAPSERYISPCALHEAVKPCESLFVSYEVSEYDCSEEIVKKSVMECIEKSGFSFVDVFTSNLKKTFMTYKHNYRLCPILLAMVLSYPVSVVFGLYIYLFLFDRSIKNMMYATMTIIGYKEWMTTIYNSIHKMLLYGK